MQISIIAYIPNINSADMENGKWDQIIVDNFDSNKEQHDHNKTLLVRIVDEIPLFASKCSRI